MINLIIIAILILLIIIWLFWKLRDYYLCCNVHENFNNFARKGFVLQIQERSENSPSTAISVSYNYWGIIISLECDSVNLNDRNFESSFVLVRSEIYISEINISEINISEIYIRNKYIRNIYQKYISEIYISEINISEIYIRNIYIRNKYIRNNYIRNNYIRNIYQK